MNPFVVWASAIRLSLTKERGRETKRGKKSRGMALINLRDAVDSPASSIDCLMSEGDRVSSWQTELMEIYMCSQRDALIPQSPVPPALIRCLHWPPILSLGHKSCRGSWPKKRRMKKVSPCYQQETWLICFKGLPPSTLPHQTTDWKTQDLRLKTQDQRLGV